MSEPVTTETLKLFLEAFNRHDLDAIMDFFAEDCVFYMPRARSREVTAISAKTRCAPAWPNGLKASRMCITAMTGIGSAAISACPNGR